jgi:dipeptidyl aminopeptidase/acylaminoacyl peptidase
MEFRRSLDGLPDAEVCPATADVLDAVDGIVVRPRGSDTPLPTILLPHGGPYARWANGFAGTLGNWGQWLAAGGYQVLLPNPRGGMGHGDAFARSVRGEVGQDDYLDIIGMLDAAIDRGLADRDRLGIGGWSQGGYMAAWAVTQTDRFNAAVVGAGVTDWGMLTMDTDAPAFEAVLGGSRPWDGPGPHRAARNSPISYTDAVTTPVLLLHGKEDRRIPPNQAIGFARALRERDVEVEQVLYPRAGHAPRERDQQLDLYRRVRDWFDRWV